MYIDSHCHLDRLDFGKLGTDLDGSAGQQRVPVVFVTFCV
jgi:hypothetical protein